MKRIAFIIDNCTIDLLKERVDKWINSHGTMKLNDGLSFSLSNIGEGKFLVLSEQFSDDIGIIEFANLIKYAEGYEKIFNLEGFLITDKISSLSEISMDKEMKITNSLKFTNDSDSIKKCKDILLKHYDDEFKGEEIDSLLIRKIDFDSIFTKINEEKEQLTKEQSKKQFKKYSLIIILMLLIDYYIYSNHYNLFSTAFIFSTGVVVSFFAVGYKMLRYNNLYIYLLLLSLIIFHFPLFIRGYLTYFWVSDIELNFALLPLTFLLIQKPLRLLFINYYKREPIIVSRFDRHGSTSNNVYTFIVFMLSIITDSIITFIVL